MTEPHADAGAIPGQPTPSPAPDAYPYPTAPYPNVDAPGSAIPGSPAPDAATPAAASADPVPAQPYPADASAAQPNPGDPHPAGQYPPAGTPYPYPVSTAPYPGSGVPYPGSGVPYPASGLPYPASGTPYPASGTPYPYAVAAPPRRGPWTVIFAIAAGVLLLAAAGLGTLTYTGNQRNSEQQSQIAELQGTIESLKDDLDDTEKRLQRAEDDIEDLEACPDAVQEFLDVVIDAASSGTVPTGDAQGIVLDMMSTCGVSF